MHYVYVLLSKVDSNLYIGCTKDLRSRLKMHNSGKVKATKLRKPLVLLHYQAFCDQRDAFAMEQWLKTGWGRNHIKKILSNHLFNQKI